MRKAGEPAPAFALRSLDGTDVTLDELRRDGPVALAFFKVSCPTCQYTLPFLQRLDGKNVVLISQDSGEDTREFHEAFGISLPTLLDERGRRYPASNAFGLEYVPSLFVVEPDATISHADVGFSRSGLESIGRRFGVDVFREGEKTPVFRPG